MEKDELIERLERYMVRVKTDLGWLRALRDRLKNSRNKWDFNDMGGGVKLMEHVIENENDLKRWDVFDGLFNSIIEFLDQWD